MNLESRGGERKEKKKDEGRSRKKKERKEGRKKRRDERRFKEFDVDRTINLSRSISNFDIMFYSTPETT